MLQIQNGETKQAIIIESLVWGSLASQIAPSTMFSSFRINIEFILKRCRSREQSGLWDLIVGYGIA